MFGSYRENKQIEFKVILFLLLGDLASWNKGVWKYHRDRKYDAICRFILVTIHLNLDQCTPIRKSDRLIGVGNGVQAILQAVILLIAEPCH